MFRHALLNNVRKFNNVRKLNKCNQIIRRFEHNNNTDIQKIVGELDDIKRNIQGSRKDNDITNYKVENALNIFMMLTGITGYCIAIIILI